MLVDWTQMSVGELLSAHGGDIKTGPFGTKLKAAEYTLDGVPVISVGEVHFGRFAVHDDTPRVNESVISRMPEYLLREGDIVFGRKGAVDRSARVRADQSGWFLGSDGIRLRLPDSCDSAFVAYQLQQKAHRAWMLQHAAGSTMPSLNEGIIRRIPIVLPPLLTQRAIAAVLRSLDDKIEQNRRMARALEALSRATFKAWFVDFEPVKAKAAGGTSFPGLSPAAFAALPDRLNDSPLGPVPQGWAVNTMGDVGEQRRDQVAPGEVDGETPYIGLEHMPRRDIALSEWGTAASVTSSKFRFRRGDILFGKLRPYFHKVGPAPLDGVCSTDIVVLYPKRPEYAAWLLMLISSDDFVAHTDRSSAGTKMPRTNWNDMAAFAATAPSSALASAFQERAGLMLELIAASIHESRKLAALRDYLLPRLLSGRVRVEVGHG